jgi:hypothetical protein
VVPLAASLGGARVLNGVLAAGWIPASDAAAPPCDGGLLVANGVSVALDETAREVNERRVLPAGGLPEGFEQQRPITALHLYEAYNRQLG